MASGILPLEKSAMQRWQHGDPFGFAEISADDILYVDPGQAKPIKGRKAYTDFMNGLVGRVFYQRSEFIAPKITEVGEAALLTYNYRSSVLAPNGTVESQTPWNTTEVYVKRQGAWRIIHSHWSYVRHHARAEVEVPVPVPSAPIEYDGVQGEILALERAAMERWRKGDPGGYLALYDPQVTYFDPATPQRVNGLESMRILYQSLEGKISYQVMDFIDPLVLALGDLAVLFYRFLSTRLESDGSIQKRTPWNCTQVYQRKQGAWRIIHNHWSHILGERA